MNLGYNIKVSNENLTFDDVKEKINNDEIREAIIIEKSAETSSNSDDLNINPELSEASESDVDVSVNSLNANLNGQNAYKLRYIVKNMATISAMPEDLLNAISTVYTNLQISKLGLTQEQLASLTANFEYSIEQAEEQEVSGNVMVIMLLSLVLFYAIYFCAYQVSSSITTEKTSKIMETLVSATVQ